MKRNKNIMMVLSIIALFMLLTWFVNSGTFNSGTYVSNGITPIGIFDIFVLGIYVLNYKAMEVIYLLMIGGTYGVLSKTTGYQKLIDKAVKLVKGSEWLAMLIITFIMGVYASITNDLLAMFLVVPFIVTVFLRCGTDRLTAISAAFGGILVGFIGQTFGTYGGASLNEALKIAVNSSIGYEILIFGITYVLFNVFAILHMKKVGKINETKYDMFMTAKVNDSKVAPRNRKKVWPLVTLFVVILVIGILAFISWDTSFGIKAFANIHTKISEITIGDQPFFKNLLGSVTEFGAWTVVFINTILLLGLVVIKFVEKIKIDDLLTNFINGSKKMYKVVLIYFLINSCYILLYYFPYAMTIINSLLGGTFNVLSVFIVGFLSLFFAIEYELVGTSLGAYLATIYPEKLAEVGLAMHLGMGFATLIAPTSALLLIALTYLDIPYTKWLKYIWKFALSLLLCLLVILLLMTLL